MIDLHIHTSNSNGTDSVEEILKKAEELKLEAISITDNENIESYKQLKDIDTRSLYSGKIIPGTEIKTMFDGVTIDVFAYDFDCEKLKNSPIVDIKKIRQAQEKYLENYKKVGKRLGLKFDDDIKVRNYASHAFYDELINYQENFEKLPELKEKKEKFFKLTQRNRKSPFFINEAKDMFNIETIINEVHKCGGKVFLAHVYKYEIETNKQFKGDKYIQFAKNLFKTTNIDGIDCYYSSYDQEQIQALLVLARQYNKYACGGSGYHGKLTEDIELGTGYGNLNIPTSILTWIK